MASMDLLGLWIESGGHLDDDILPTRLTFGIKQSPMITRDIEGEVW
jgi:hypothetical protein